MISYFLANFPVFLLVASQQCQSVATGDQKKTGKLIKRGILYYQISDMMVGKYLSSLYVGKYLENSCRNCLWVFSNASSKGMIMKKNVVLFQL